MLPTLRQPPRGLTRGFHPFSSRQNLVTELLLALVQALGPYVIGSSTEFPLPGKERVWMFENIQSRLLMAIH